MSFNHISAQFFAWASVPHSDLIAGFFCGAFQAVIRDDMPAAHQVSLISEGIIPGIGGVVDYHSQIAMLFGFLADSWRISGYMSRVVS